MTAKMNNETVLQFEYSVRDFLMNSISDREALGITIASVEVVSQTLISGNKDTNSSTAGTENIRWRQLQVAKLKIGFVVEGEVARGKSSTFSIENVVREEFQRNPAEFTKRLAANSNFFEKFDQKDSVINSANTGETMDKVDPSKWIIIASAGCVALAVLLGSIFLMDRKSKGKKQVTAVIGGNDLVSYDLRGHVDTRPPAIAITTARTKDPTEPKSRGEKQVAENSSHGGHGQNTLSSHNISGSLINEEMSSQLNKEKGKKKEGTTASRPMGIPFKSLADDAESFEKSTDDNKSESLDLGPIMDLHMTPSMLNNEVKKPDSNIYVFSGTNDAKQSTSSSSNPPDELRTSVSDLSCPSNEFSTIHGGGEAIDYGHAEKMIGDQYDTSAILTPLAPRTRKQGGRDENDTGAFITTQKSSRSRKEKLFDCFAPPGPLGIIIDTTPEGPTIHSLKPTSQLLGLIKPGDLIVGLDGVDTRNMTAATFTRLMAKRSQGERKITLQKGHSTPKAS